MPFPFKFPLSAFPPAPTSEGEIGEVPIWRGPHTEPLPAEPLNLVSREEHEIVLERVRFLTERIAKLEQAEAERKAVAERGHSHWSRLWRDRRQANG